MLSRRQSSRSSSISNQPKKNKSIIDFNVILSLSDENYLTKDVIVNTLGLLNSYPHVKRIVLDIGKQSNSSSSLPDRGLKSVPDEIKEQFSQDIKFNLTNDLINNTDIDKSKNYIFITDDITRLDNDKFEQIKQLQRYVSILCKKDKHIITEILKFLETLQLDPNSTLIDIDNPKDRKPTDKESKLYETIRQNMGMKENIPYLNQDGGSGELKVRISGTQPAELKDKDVLFFYHDDDKSIKLLTKLFKQGKIKNTKKTKELKKLTKKNKKQQSKSLRKKSIKKLNIQQNTAVSERVKKYNTTLGKIDQERLKKKEELNKKLDLMSDLLKDLKNENDEKKVNDINRQINELHNEIQELIPQQTIDQNTENELQTVIQTVDVNKKSQLPTLNNKLQNLNIERNNAQKQAIKNIEEKERLKEEEKRKKEAKEISRASKKALKKAKKGFLTRLRRTRKRNIEHKKAEQSILGKPGLFQRIKNKLTRKRKKKQTSTIKKSNSNYYTGL